MRTRVCLLLIILFTVEAAAKSRPRHQHEDIFGEDDLWLGMKVGPKVSSYTDYNSISGKMSVQAEAQYSLGAALKFIYSVPRVELNVLWNVRSGINNDRDLHFVSFPLLVKIPFELEDSFDLELGAGGQADGLIYSNHESRRWLTGFLGTIGIAYDFEVYIFEFEVRYLLGGQPLTASIDGAKPRDLHIFAGLLWRF